MQGLQRFPENVNSSFKIKITKPKITRLSSQFLWQNYKGSTFYSYFFTDFPVLIFQEISRKYFRKNLNFRKQFLISTGFNLCLNYCTKEIEILPQTQIFFQIPLFLQPNVV